MNAQTPSWTFKLFNLGKTFINGTLAPTILSGICSLQTLVTFCELALSCHSPAKQQVSPVVTADFAQSLASCSSNFLRWYLRTPEARSSVIKGNHPFIPSLRPTLLSGLSESLWLEWASQLCSTSSDCSNSAVIQLLAMGRSKKVIKTGRRQLHVTLASSDIQFLILSANQIPEACQITPVCGLPAHMFEGLGTSQQCVEEHSVSTKSSGRNKITGQK